MRFVKTAAQASLAFLLKWAAAGTRLTTYRERCKMLPPLVILMVAGAFLFILDLLLRADVRMWISIPEGVSAYEFWVGKKSVLDVALGLVTTLIAVAAAFLALRSYQVNQRAAVANRYQKGIELLGAEADSSKLGGVELLSIVAREAPEEYQEPVLRTLRHLMQERSAAIVKAAEAAAVERRELPATDPVVIAALSVVTRTNARHRWLEQESDADGLTLRGIYLHDLWIFRSDFSRVSFRDGVFGDIRFDSCQFGQTFIACRVFGSVNFDNCSIRNSEILALNIDGSPVQDPQLQFSVSRSCHTSGFLVNDKRLHPLND